MDAISLLKDDHRTVERLFKRFEKTASGALDERRRIVDEIIKELSVHAEIEETIFYPVVREAVPPTEDMVLESLEEHHVAKWVLSELDGMDPGAERFEAKVTVLMENIRHHVEEEESDLFPSVRKALGRKALNEMGDAMARAKTVAPTRPHPRSPDTPPGNIVSGIVASALDRAREAGQGLVEGVGGAARRAAGGGSAPSSSTPATRRAAGATKTRAKKASGTAKKRSTGTAKKKATGTARRTTKKAAGTGTRATKKATGTAKKTARKTATTAKRATGTTKSSARRTATGTSKSTARTARTATASRPRKAAKKRS